VNSTTISAQNRFAHIPIMIYKGPEIKTVITKFLKPILTKMNEIKNHVKEIFLVPDLKGLSMKWES
jgi:hypothetical protein